MTTVHATREVQCPFGSAVELIERFHGTTNHRAGPFSWLQVHVECSLAETRDYTDPARRHEALVLQWRTHGLFPMPRLRALITVRPHWEATELRIDGSYLPPLGIAGRMFDVFIGRRIALRT